MTEMGNRWEFGKRSFGLRAAALVTAGTMLLGLAGCQAPAPETALVTESATGTETLPAEETAPAAEAESALPAPGEEIFGFRVADITPFPQKAARIVSMDHIKSGAELLYIACEDPDKAVNVYYRTAAETDQGLPHVFEHITLSGSGKYPSADLWDEVSQKTYNTYLNASTWQHMTTYNMASLSEDQLLAIMDFYMDGLTDPMALRDEHPLKRESYRFELESPEEEISVTGAVFNEMEAANADREEYAIHQIRKHLYPGSTMAHISGGYRDDIITITLDDLKEFYGKYYHPSNMLIVLYGDMDYRAFLEALDRDYLSRYDKKEILIPEEKYDSWEGEKTEVISYPASEESSPEGSSLIYQAIPLGNIGLYNLQLLGVVSQILSSESSLLTRRMEEEFPSAVFDISMETDLREPVFCFSLTDANPGDGERFRIVLLEALEEIAEEGLNKDQVDVIRRNQEINTILSAQESGGVGTCDSFGLSWALSGDRLAYLDTFRAIDELREEADKGTLDRLLEEFLVNPERTLLLECNPEPGLMEKMDEAFEEKLHAMKENMSEEEILALVESTEEFSRWTEESAENSLLDKVKAVEIADLPEDVKEVEINDSLENGIRRITSVIPGAPYVEMQVYLDAGTLDYEKIHDFMFLNELLGSLATENHTPDTLEDAMDKAAFRWSLAPEIIYDDWTGDPHPYLTFSTMELSDTVEEAWSLMEEILFTTDFSDTDRIRYLASAAASGWLSEKNGNPGGTALRTAFAAANPDQRYEYHASSFDYLAYLRQIAGMDEEELKALTGRMKETLQELLNRNGAIYTAVGSEELLSLDGACADAFFERLEDTAREAADYSGELEKINLPKRIAVQAADFVNYNGVAAANADTGFSDNGTDAVIYSLLNGKLIYPAFRYRIGAYGCQGQIGRYSSFLSSYRDPGIADSFAYLENLPEEIRSADISQEEVNDAILSVYSDYAYPRWPLDAAWTEIAYAIQGREESLAEETIHKMENAKKVTTEDIPAFADKMEKLIKDGVWVTAGSAQAIRKYLGGYDLVIEDLVK